MIQSYLVGKNVSWYNLEKSMCGGKPDYVRNHYFGTVEAVSLCGGLCLVRDSTGTKHEVETPELFIKEST